MIELFHCTSPNVIKVLIMLEEADVEYRTTSVDISQGEHLLPEFLAVSLNAKLPAIVDHDPADGGEPIRLFESGAILQYLAEKTGRFLPSDVRGRTEAMQWLFWQMANLGPMSGQVRHFTRLGPRLRPEVDFSYGADRYLRETNRLYGCLDARLADRPCVAGDYSIGDMAIYPWVVLAEDLGQRLADFPNVSRWFAELGERPGIRRAYERNAAEAAATHGWEPGTNRAMYPWEGIAQNLFFKTAELYRRS
jgi:GST-like protein